MGYEEREFRPRSNGPSRGGPNRGGPNRGGPRRSFGPKEMHKAVCSGCGNECEVPFKPTEGRDVFCKECFSKNRER